MPLEDTSTLPEGVVQRDRSVVQLALQVPAMQSQDFIRDEAQSRVRIKKLELRIGETTTG